MTTIKEGMEERFDKEFLNPDKFSSVSQFRPEIVGQLPQRFKLFIQKEIKEAIKEEREWLYSELGQLANRGSIPSDSALWLQTLIKQRNSSL